LGNWSKRTIWSDPNVATLPLFVIVNSQVKAALGKFTELTGLPPTVATLVTVKSG
jgi:hypothetical protein